MFADDFYCLFCFLAYILFSFNRNKINNIYKNTKVERSLGIHCFFNMFLLVLRDYLPVDIIHISSGQF